MLICWKVNLMYLRISCAVGLLLALPAAAQVFWNADYDSLFPFCSCTSAVNARVGDQPPIATTTITNSGGTQGNYLLMTVDSAQTTELWTAMCYQTPCAVPSPPVVLDPRHTFLKCDVLVSKLRPVTICLYYQCSLTGGNSSLCLQVEPSVVGSFQTFLVPLWPCVTNFNNCSGTFVPGFPTSFMFYIRGDPANPDTTWPSAPDNIVAIDNIAVIIQPVLDMAVSQDNVTLSWPTNATGFVLQQTVDLNNWVTVTNAPVLTNGVSQVVVSPAAPQSSFRLSGP